MNGTTIALVGLAMVVGGLIWWFGRVGRVRIPKNRTPFLVWMLAGGLCYSIGTIFLMMDVKRFYFHVIWHLLVMAGSGCHFYGIYRYVACT